MEKLNIDWLHKGGKQGRRSGRTTEMLANVVGIAQLSNDTTHVMVICTDSNSMYADFIDVLRAIDPSAKYNMTICRGYPAVAVVSEYGCLCYVMFSQRNLAHWANGMKNAYQVVDHYYVEKQYDTIMRGPIEWATNKRAGFRGYGIY